MAKKRPRCPFYGFYMSSSLIGLLMDQEGNHCALITDSYSPCQMDPSGKRTNWEECTFNSEKYKELLDRLARTYKICPKELWPEGENSWGGITLKEWIDRVMAQR